MTLSVVLNIPIMLAAADVLNRGSSLYVFIIKLVISKRSSYSLQNSPITPKSLGLSLVAFEKKKLLRRVGKSPDLVKKSSHLGKTTLRRVSLPKAVYQGL